MCEVRENCVKLDSGFYGWLAVYDWMVGFVLIEVGLMVVKMKKRTSSSKSAWLGIGVELKDSEWAF